ncbi:RNA-directed DNA polymerase, eukaryota, reverse transcriptase zinc-binding domain protein [Tanacetum coccineum]|uniref:RNA-directed DNA polymerase, eukaryota, reverse transcriptase zinc-binding domain protein n=1 Tax=Tanacetum coccineum TaxID=301880 RepID=A0ABQ5HU65_9ASTR
MADGSDFEAIYRILRKEWRCCKGEISFTNEEIKDAIFGIGNDKAPGPYGYTSMVFKQSWDIVGGDVCGAVKEFFKSNKLLGEDFLKQILIHFGFHEKIIGWIMTCVTSAAFTVCVNGERYGYFKSGRGLRQGDPMSPYLFTLVMEILTLIIQRRVSKMEVLKEGLMGFSKISGLVPNMNKSTIFFGNVKESEKQRILELVERVKQKVNDWKNKALSYAGRLQLIAFVLASMHIYWASVFLIPKTTVKDIEKALKVFLWCHGDFKRGAAKVAWKIVCAPKSQGGLGIKRLGPWNEALLCKHLWNVIDNKDSLWVKWVNTVKLKDKSIWEVDIERIPDSELEINFTILEAWPNDWKAQFSWINDIKVPILEEGENDCIIWKDNSGKSMKFSIRSVWEKFKDFKSEVSWYKVIWYPQCNPRHAFIAWLAMHRRLATQDRIMVWCKTSNLLCPLCKKENDSHEHLFFKCTYSEDIWSNVKDKVGRRNWSNEWVKVASTIVKEGCNSRIKSVLDRMVFATVIYFIWNERNKRIFTQEQRNAQDILNGIVESIKMQLMCLKNGFDKAFASSGTLYLGVFLGNVARMEEPLMQGQTLSALVNSWGLSAELKQLWLKDSIRDKLLDFVGIQETKLEYIDYQVTLLNVYGPQSSARKEALWSEIYDLNASEILLVSMILSPKLAFVTFNLVVEDILISIRNKKGTKISKLDRFLISPNFFDHWPNASVTALERLISDHCGLSGDVILKNKLKRLKSDLRLWADKIRNEASQRIIDLKAKLMEWDSKAELSLIRDEDIHASEFDVFELMRLN